MRPRVCGLALACCPWHPSGRTLQMPYVQYASESMCSLQPLLPRVRHRTCGPPSQLSPWNPPTLQVMTASEDGTVRMWDAAELVQKTVGGTTLLLDRDVIIHAARGLRSSRAHPDRWRSHTPTPVQPPSSFLTQLRILLTQTPLQVIKPTLAKPGRTAVTTCAFGAGGKLIGAGLMDGTIQLWSVAGGCWM